MSKLSDYGERKQRLIERDATRKLVKIFRSIKLPLDFEKESLEENLYRIDGVFRDVYLFLESLSEVTTVNALDFSRRQLQELNRGRVKADVEITVNWAKVEENALSFLRNGGDFSNPYLDIVSSAIANGNRHWLRNEYIAYVLGEKTLKEAYINLSNRILDSDRANMIIRGEITSVWATAQQEAYAASGTRKNAWETRNDGPKVCPICAPLNQLETVIGQPFPNTRYTKPPAHGGCRCFLSPVPLTDEELEDLIKQGSNSVRKVKDNRNKTEETKLTVEQPTKPQTVSDLKNAFDKINSEKGLILSSLADEEIKETTKLRTYNTKITKIKADIERIKIGKLTGDVDKLTKLKSETETLRDNQFNKVKDIVDRRNNLDNELLNKQRELLFADKPSKFKIDKIDYINNKNINDGVDFFNKIIPDDFVTKKGDTVVSIRKNNTDREFYLNDFERALWLTDKTSVRTTVHELGHWLEYRNDRINNEAVSFLRRRTAGETPQKLRDLTGIKEYGEDEETRPDKFKSPYVGKEYRRVVNGKVVTTTEVVSMGLEQLYVNPAKFLSEDEDFFSFIVKDVLGRVK